ncbi:hypothetical protein BDY19DRAFT_1059765 [Irpex rosettiformis]|uniref:Uncharacterized protein n=1 Tax=Irpex rosettiformis TaxID=378272 RepID=A0ACB8TSY2_9APHY|nr:hypothetical protein BDY19DRAFT_1059765 [Irpex rosettiformis]
MLTLLPPTMCNPAQAVSTPIICSNRVAEGHEVIVQDVGPAVPQVPVQWFKDYLLPHLPVNLDLHAVVDHLKQHHAITGFGTWKKSSTAPVDSARTNDDADVFASLETIAFEIRKAAQAVLPTLEEQTVVFQYKSNCFSSSSSLRRNSASRPDGYGLYTKHPAYKKNAERVFWECIVAPCEIKKTRNIDGVNDNIAKILWSFHHIMREDASRRFVIGYTIENTDMRLWFGSRTDALVSDPFDFTRDHEALAHFFLALMFAKAHELGYDPTMQPARDGKRWLNQWDITLHYFPEGDDDDLSGPIDVSKLQTVVLRTQKLESNIGAEAMRSRGTRVWQARILGPNGQLSDRIVVLKDYWVDHDRLREATIRQRILDDAKTEDQRDVLRRHLLTPLYSGDVVIAGQRDNTHSLLRRGAKVPIGTLYPIVHEEVALTATAIPEDEPFAPQQGTDTIASQTERLLKLIMLNDKSHHRIVFAEVAVTIEDMQSAKRVFNIAEQTTTALNVIHQCGWVHRDISSGNILVVPGDIAKVGDLEYAKKMSDKTSHSERSGTAFFMSIEAGMNDYQFVPRRTKPPVKQDRRRPKPSSTPNTDNTHSVGADTLSPFRYNPLHDLESLWWVLVYLLLRRKAVIEGDTVGRCKEQAEFYDQLFTGTAIYRQRAFQIESIFQQGKTKLHPRLTPIADTLEWARDLLVIQYEEIEARKETIVKIDHTVGDEIAKLLIKEFKTVAGEFTNVNPDIELSRLRPVRGKKITPEQPGAAVAIGTSLDSRGEGSSKKRPFEQDVADSTTVHYQDLQEYAEEIQSKRAKLEEKEIQERQQRERNNLEVQSEEHASQSNVKGKGKGKEIL